MKFFARFSKRTVLLSVDTALVSVSSAATLLLAARSLELDELNAFSLMQLFIVTLVGLQRATILAPALATQRAAGRATLPLRWMLTLSAPISVIASVVMPFGLGPTNQNYSSLVLLSLATALPVLGQDLLRYVCFSREATMTAMVSDAVYLLGVAIGFVTLVFLGEDDWVTFAGVWAVAVAVAITVGAFGLLWQKGEVLPALRLREVLRLGKWSGADAAMSGFANLLPMLVSALALGTPHAALYRLVQVTLGPLNILNATLATSMGMDSWKLRGASELHRLNTNVKQLSTRLMLASAIYLVLSLPIVVLIAGISDRYIFVAAGVTLIAGVLGAGSTPFSAAAAALGYQRYGVAIRTLIVGFAVATSLISAGGVVGAFDPIATVTVFSALTGLVGWYMAYRRAVHREIGGI